LKKLRDAGQQHSAQSGVRELQLRVNTAVRAGRA